MNNPGDRFNPYTFFFREREAIEMVRDTVLQPLAASGRRAAVWCAGCATGEEPYSLAIAACEAGVGVDILATDINVEALRRARQAAYGPQSLRHVAPAQLDRWFVRRRDEHVLAEAPRRLVTFVQHDVTAEPPKRPQAASTPWDSWDVVFCRNVLIYYEPEAAARAVTNILSVLAPGGLLLIGASEWLRACVHACIGLRLPRLAERRGVLAYVNADSGDEPLRLSPVVVPSSVPRVDRDAEPAVDGLLAAATGSLPSGLGEPAPSPPTSSAGSSGTPVTADEDVDIARMRTEGDLLLDQNRADEALSVYASASAKSPTTPDLYLRAAVCHLRCVAPDQAQDALRRALFLDSDLWPAALMLGDLLEDVDPPAARKYLQWAARILSSSAADDAQLPAALAPFLMAKKAALELIAVRLGVLQERDHRAEDLRAVRPRALSTSTMSGRSRCTT